MSNKKYFLFLVLGMILTGCYKLDIEPIPDHEVQTTEYMGQRVEDIFIIRVHLPKDYETTPFESYPVLYQMDGGTTTGSVIRDYNELIAAGSILPYITVSIDHKGEDNRNRDYTPSTHSNYGNSGGAEDFLQLMDKELIPMIDSLYRTDTDFGNTLRGHSLGGLFGGYALFQNASLQHPFKNFIIESPSFWWDDNYIFELEDSYNNANNDLVAKAYFSMGELEQGIMKITFEALEKKLRERAYPNFSAEFEILRNQTHTDVRENEKGLLSIF